MLQRLCLALAAIAARSGTVAGAQLVEQALQLAAVAAANSAQVRCELHCLQTLSETGQLGSWERPTHVSKPRDFVRSRWGWRCSC